MQLTPDLRAYYKGVAAEGNYLQIMQHLICSVTDTEENGERWVSARSFCEDEIEPNIDFIVTAALEERESGEEE